MYDKAPFNKPELGLGKIVLVCCNRTCYCVGTVSVMSASRYQSRYSMYIRGMIPRDWQRQCQLKYVCDLKTFRSAFF